MDAKNIVDLGQVRAILAEMDKARAAVIASELEEFQQAAMRAILLASTVRRDEAPHFRESQM